MNEVGVSPALVWLLSVLLACAGCGATTAGAAHRSTAHTPPRGQAMVHRVAAHAVDAAAFAPGACVAFPPTVGDRHLTVFLDAGHGGLDPGAVGRTASGRTIFEANETLAVELDTLGVLREQGFTVVVSRTRNSLVVRPGPGDRSGAVLTARGSHADVLARDACANDAHANVLVGIYFNAGARSNAGCLTAYDALRPFVGSNLRLARLVESDVLAAMNAQGWRIPNDGVTSDVGLGSTVSAQGLAYGHLSLLGPAKAGYVSTPSRMPGALIEPLFITDPFEGSIAASVRGQNVIADGLAKAIEQYFTPAR